MKNFTIIICCFLTISIVYAQNTEPTTHQFTIDGHQVTPSPEYSLFKQNKMLLGWHWCSGKKMTESLLMSQAHVQTPFRYDTCLYCNNWWDLDTTGLADNVDLIMNIPFISDKLNGYDYNRRPYVISPTVGKSFTIEPTLQIINPGYDTVRKDDPSNAIFGFKHIQGIISTDTSDINYNRLVLICIPAILFLLNHGLSTVCIIIPETIMNIG